MVDLVSDGSQELQMIVPKRPKLVLPRQVSDPKPSVYLLPRGRDMPAKRIESLTLALQKNTDFFVQKEFNAKELPKYIVVSKTLELEALRKHLRYSSIDEMSRCLEGVHIVISSWVIGRTSSGFTSDSVEQEPAMDECWSKLHTLRMRQKRNFEDSAPSPLVNTWLVVKCKIMLDLLVSIYMTPR